MPGRELPWLRLVVLAALAAVVVAVIVIVRAGQAVPDAVQPIAWNREPCAHCHMLVGEPRHAAQIVTDTGAVLAFDDPGCALRYVEDRRPIVHRQWFHHATTERWLAVDDVAFQTGGTTPMGSGLLAVERGTPGAVDLATARRIAREPGR